MHNTYIQLTRLTKEKCNNHLNVINWDLMDLAFNLELDDCDYQETHVPVLPIPLPAV